MLSTDGSGALSWVTTASGGAASVTELSDALVEGSSIYIGNDPSSTTDSALNNLAIGATALGVITTGDNNTAVGQGALAANTTGRHNAAFGT